jgi:5-methylcytosine-specific restriction endonuclease McrA
MSMILECIGCREEKVFQEFDPYPVCPDCQEWEERTFKNEHEETFHIRRAERNVVHNGHREGIIARIFRKKVSISNDFRWAIFERDDFTCQHCGSRRDLTVDHIQPEAKGGELTMENAQTLCRSCNSKKGAKS